MTDHYQLEFINEKDKKPRGWVADSISFPYYPELRVTNWKDFESEFDLGLPKREEIEERILQHVFGKKKVDPDNLPILIAVNASCYIENSYGDSWAESAVIVDFYRQPNTKEKQMAKTAAKYKKRAELGKEIEIKSSALIDLQSMLNSEDIDEAGKSAFEKAIKQKEQEIKALEAELKALK